MDHCCPPDRRATWLGCVFVRSWSVQVSGDAGIAIAVPLPHGSQCLSPQEWEGAKVATHKAQASWRDVDDQGYQGRTFWVVLEEGGDASAWLNTTGKADCQTFRHDPWSLDPDPIADNVTVLLAGGSGQVSVQYTYHDGAGCAQGTRATATFAQAGWMTLPTSSATACV